MKRYILTLVVIFATGDSYSQPINEELNNLIAQQLPQATVGVVIKNLRSGEVIYKYNSDKLLNPASNIKVFTAAAAAYYLGSEYSYATTLLQKNKTIYVRFSGDPSLTPDDLENLLANLNQLGIETIDGDLVIDASQFKPPYHAAGMSYDDIGWYYEAPSSAVILNENKEAFELISAKKLGQPIQIKPKGTNSAITLVNDVISVNKEQEKNHCNFNIAIKPNNTLHLYGCMLQYAQVKQVEFAIIDPELFAQQVINNILQKKKILLRGKILFAQTPAQAKLIASHQSKTLPQLLTHMLEESDNLYADSLTKLLGYSLTQYGTYKQGAYAIKKILAKHTNLDLSSIELADGHGTRYDLITPEQMVILLSDIYHDEKIKPVIISSLPRMGVTGTLKDRMKNTRLQNIVFAKTGTMHDVSSLSGYILSESGDPLVFSIIINGAHGKIASAKQLEEKILLSIIH